MLHLFNSVFGLFASTVFTCVGLNFTASDQYLQCSSIKMYAKAYRIRAALKIGRTLEDSGTVTSVLVPVIPVVLSSEVLGVVLENMLPMRSLIGYLHL